MPEQDVDMPLLTLPEVDTVCFSLPDAFGRLMGKRYTASYVRSHPDLEIRISELVLASDARMAPIAGLSGSLVPGNGDIRLLPDWTTARQLPWAKGEVLVICDAVMPNGDAIEAAPRSVLKRQAERLAAAGLYARMASELEFYLLPMPELSAADSSARMLVNHLEPCPDNHLLLAGRHEPIIHEIRVALAALGLGVEYSKSEGGRGQYEIVVGHMQPLEMADAHALYKLCVKEVARRHGMVASFIAKLSEFDDGSGGHVHCSVSNISGTVDNQDAVTALTPTLAMFVAGLCDTAADLCALFAPTPNSYKRLWGGALAPSEVNWSLDDRRAALRVVGTGANQRVECRIPGADVNPYLALAAILAGGLAGIERRLDLPEANWRVPLPRDLIDAVSRFQASTGARHAFGDKMIDFYSRLLSWEAGEAAVSVTDWERGRYLSEI